MFKANATRNFRHARATLIACLIALVGLLISVDSEAGGDGAYGGAVLQRVQFRGPGVVDERANERAMQQAARAQRQQQMHEQRAQRNDHRPEPENQRAPAPPAPVYRAPDAGDPRLGHPGRLTPEERRALRQQINEAGRDVYRPNPRP